MHVLNCGTPVGRSGLEEPHEVIVGHRGCKTSGAGSVAVLRVGISASGQEGTHNLAISVTHVEQRPPQRGVTKPVAGIQVRSSFDQYGGCICVLVLGSEVQRGETFPVGGIHLIAAISEVSSHVTGPALDGGVEQRRPSCTVKLRSHVSSLWFRPVLARDCHVNALGKTFNAVNVTAVTVPPMITTSARGMCLGSWSHVSARAGGPKASKLPHMMARLCRSWLRK
jgi:hypothetical protein